MKEDYQSLKLENQICFPLYAASREVIKKYRPYLDAIDLTYTQYIAMMVFWAEKKISVKDLGKKLYLDSGTLSPVLKSLEVKGLVTRYRDMLDERVLIVEVTPQGMELKERAKQIPESLVKCVKMSEEDSLKLYELLYKLLDSIKD